MPVLPLFDETFLRAQWDAEFTAFQESVESSALLQRLKAWANREQLNERASETAFIQRFFVETWGYSLQGHDAGDSAYTCRPQFDATLATKESALNTLIYRLYRLTPEEIATVEAG